MSQVGIGIDPLRRERLRLLKQTSLIIHYFGWQARSRFGGHCPRWGRFAQADCRHEMRPMTFLDPGSFIGTDQGEPPVPFDTVNHRGKPPISELRLNCFPV
jgi:hypothetical protein